MVNAKKDGGGEYVIKCPLGSFKVAKFGRQNDVLLLLKDN